MLNEKEQNEITEGKTKTEGGTKPIVRKQLLRHKPAITPTQPFTINEIEKDVIQPPSPNKKKSVVDDPISSIRVRTSTRNKINALINLGRADTADVLIDILIDEYLNANLTKDERKTYEMLYQVLQNRK